jgi:hypothetical protein
MIASAASVAEDIRFSKAKRLTGQYGHLTGVSHAPWSGAGVGIAGVHHHGLGGVVFQMLDAHLHRRGTNLVRGEHSGGFRGRVGDDQCQVVLLSLVAALAGAECFDIAKAGRRAEAKRRSD